VTKYNIAVCHTVFQGAQSRFKEILQPKSPSPSDIFSKKCIFEGRARWIFDMTRFGFFDAHTSNHPRPRSIKEGYDRWVLSMREGGRHSGPAEQGTFLKMELLDT
jgi:hypothetical protein